MVEVAISLALFTILAYAGTNFFIQAVRDSNKVAIENEVRETGSTLMSDITSEIQNIIKDDINRSKFCIKTIPAGGVTLPYSLYLSDMNGPSLSCSDSGWTRRVVYTVDAQGNMTKSVNGATAVRINPDKAVILSCPIAGGGCSTGIASCNSGLQVSFSGTTPTVNVYVQQVSSVAKSDYCARTQVTQTVVPRQRP